MPTSPTQTWYKSQKKPRFAPPAWIFAPVWTVLYIIIAVSFGTVFLRTLENVWPAAVALPFAINIVANLLFAPLQFRLQKNLLALADILVILVTIPLMIVTILPLSPRIAWAQVPYLLWVSFATVLQVSVTWMNRRKKRK
jgi:tryptophan-rich sensory protein